MICFVCPTDSTGSIEPAFTTANFVLSLPLQEKLIIAKNRDIRFCSENEFFDKLSNELEGWLLENNYSRC